MKDMNKDVPIETILKHVLVENGKLKSEIQYLENELAIRNRQIKAFKKWQAEYTQKSYQYWLDYAQGLAYENKIPIDQERIKAARKILTNYDNYKSMLKQLQVACDKIKEGIDSMQACNEC